MKMIAFAATALGITALLGAQTPARAESAAKSAVGEWLYDVNGELVGSVYGVSDDGRTVIVQYGTYLTPGRHLVSLPASDVVIFDGHAMLSMLTADALRDRLGTN